MNNSGRHVTVLRVSEGNKNSKRWVWVLTLAWLGLVLLQTAARLTPQPVAPSDDFGGRLAVCLTRAGLGEPPGRIREQLLQAAAEQLPAGPPRALVEALKRESSKVGSPEWRFKAERAGSLPAEWRAVEELAGRGAEERRAATRGDRLRARVLVGLVLATGLGGLAGLGLTLFAPRRVAADEEEPISGLRLGNAWALFVTWQLLQLLVGPLWLAALPSPPLGVIARSVLVQLALYALGWWLLRPGRARMRWKIGSGDLLRGLLGYWVAGLLVFMVARAVAALTGSPPVSRNPALELLRYAGAFEYAQLFVLVVLAGPLFEEVMFRGLLYSSLRLEWGGMKATLASAALFSLVHADPPGFVPYFALGVVFAALFERTRSLTAPVLAHALFNAQTLLVVMLVSPGAG